jgi:hypothetical protein
MLSSLREMYLEEERKIRTHLESARIEAQSRSEKFERRLHAHTAAAKGREDLLTKRLALAEEQKQRIEKDLANLREELTTSKGSPRFCTCVRACGRACVRWWWCTCSRSTH